MMLDCVLIQRTVVVKISHMLGFILLKGQGKRCRFISLFVLFVLMSVTPQKSRKQAEKRRFSSFANFESFGRSFKGLVAYFM